MNPLLILFKQLNPIEYSILDSTALKHPTKPTNQKETKTERKKKFTKGICVRSEKQVEAKKKKSDHTLEGKEKRRDKSRKTRAKKERKTQRTEKERRFLNT